MFVGNGKPNWLRRMSINKVGGDIECFGPKGGWHVCLEEKHTHDIVDGVNGTFGLAILWRGVWAGEAK